MTLNEIGGQARAVSRILNSLGSREKILDWRKQPERCLRARMRSLLQMRQIMRWHGKRA